MYGRIPSRVEQVGMTNDDAYPRLFTSLTERSFGQNPVCEDNIDLAYFSNTMHTEGSIIAVGSRKRGLTCGMLLPLEVMPNGALGQNKIPFQVASRAHAITRDHLPHYCSSYTGFASDPNLRHIQLVTELHYQTLCSNLRPSYFATPLIVSTRDMIFSLFLKTQNQRCC